MFHNLICHFYRAFVVNDQVLDLKWVRFEHVWDFLRQFILALFSLILIWPTLEPNLISLTNGYPDRRNLNNRRETYFFPLKIDRFLISRSWRSHLIKAYTNLSYHKHFRRHFDKVKNAFNITSDNYVNIDSRR